MIGKSMIMGQEHGYKDYPIVVIDSLTDRV